MPTNERWGVLLVNTGTPSAPKPRAVRAYLSRFLMDERIRPMNRVGWWLVLHLFILPKRGRASAAKYAKIWTDEGSPFSIYHDRLQSGLQDRLQAEGFDALVRCGMSYADPTVPACLLELEQAGCTRLAVLPLYPQSAYSTTGSVSDSVRRALADMRWDVPLSFVEDYHDHPSYIRAVAASIREAGFGERENDRLLFSFHSIPLNDIEAGDTYELQAGASSLQIASELGLDRNRWTIGYQCRFDKGREWLKPFSRDTLARWAAAGEGRVFLVCPNFAVDCLETLYDIEYETKPFYSEQARRAHRPQDERQLSYVPCLNCTDAHLGVLADVLRPYLEEENHG